jgi:hypothetical protein
VTGGRPGAARAGLAHLDTRTQSKGATMPLCEVMPARSGSAAGNLTWPPARLLYFRRLATRFRERCSSRGRMAPGGRGERG